MLLLLIGVIVVVCLYMVIKQNYYWKGRGIKQHAFVLPFIGDSWRQLLGMQSFAERMEFEYKQFYGQRYFGIYEFQLPILMVTDPDLIKQMCVKEFDHFVDHPNFIPEDVDPLWSKNLLALRGQRWKDMRATLSPSFTTSKMKQLFVLMAENAKTFTKFFLEKKNDSIEFETKNHFQRYTNDVIANTVFGVSCDSLVDENNEFYQNGIDITNFTGFWNTLKVAILFFYPSFAKIFKVSLFPKACSMFFQGVVRESIKYRQENKVTRPDMINLLLQARKDIEKYSNDDSGVTTEFSAAKEDLVNKEVLKHCTFTNDDIAAQAVIFFFAGFEQVSVMSSWMAYELALNPDVQRRLIEEIDETAILGDLTYDRLVQMTYMDMVVSETLRKWPVSILTDRICTKEYTIKAKNSGEKDVVIEKGTTIWFPFYAYHRDPKIFANPEKFDPERFSMENRHEINQYSYMPFGAGSRICIASRFALMEMKALFFYLLREFEIVPTEKTEIPMPQKLTGFTLQAKNGCFLKLVKRK